MNYSKNSKRVSLVLKIVTIVSAIIGIYLSVYDRTDSFMGGATVFMHLAL